MNMGATAEPKHIRLVCVGDEEAQQDRAGVHPLTGATDVDGDRLAARR